MKLKEWLKSIKPEITRFDIVRVKVKRKNEEITINRNEWEKYNDCDVKTYRYITEGTYIMGDSFTLVMYECYLDQDQYNLINNIKPERPRKKRFKLPDYGLGEFVYE